ncbi:MAG: DUF554 domain-containing protein [Clostridia bacterium]|nr:DUF554 domain-containing protein [Clostridia bacterium]
MIGLGTLINSGLVIAGSILGMLFGHLLNQRVRETMTGACGLSTLFIGAGGTLSKMLTLSGDGKFGTGGTMTIILSMVLGGMIGEFINIEHRTEQLAAWLKVRSHSEKDTRFIDGFVTSSLTICIGAMAIIGPMNDALYHDYSLLITKGILDFIIVMALASSLGKGVLFSVLPLALWQGLMTLIAALIGPFLSTPALDAISMVGNILIFCVGLNLLFNKHIRVANYLPSLVFAVIFSGISL